MRMLLTSGGIREGLVRSTFLELLGKPPSDSGVAFVIDAILPFSGDKSHLLADLEQLHSLGWKQFDVLSLLSGPHSVIESRLRSADVIYCYGGSNHWLAQAWTSTGFAPLLAELLDEKVYVGVSAGSMIFSRLHEAAVDAFDDHAEVEMLQLDSVAPALPLFDWFLIAHLGASYFPHQTDEWAAAGASRLGGPIWYIDDETALLVRDPTADPHVISSGHWLRFNASGALTDSGRQST